MDNSQNQEASISSKQPINKKKQQSNKVSDINSQCTSLTLEKKFSQIMKVDYIPSNNDTLNKQKQFILQIFDEVRKKLVVEGGLKLDLNFPIREENIPVI